MVLLVLLVLGMVAVGQGMVCPPDYCKTRTCEAITVCNGRIAERGGFCGCCETCLTQIDEGVSCWNTMIWGVPPTSECGAGLHCDGESKVCVKSVAVNKRQATAPCTQRMEALKKAQETGLPLFGVQTPKCDSNGFYAGVQCTGSVCYCVDTMGQVLGYQTSIGNIASIDCQCARDKAAYIASGLIGKLFYCESNGNYPATAVTQPLVAMTTQPPAVMTTKAAMMTNAPIGNLGVTGAPSAPKGVCAMKKAEVMKQQSSSPLLGVEIPHCDADGLYAPRQCAGSECYCVRKDGTKLGDYSSPRWMEVQITCQCARDKDQFASSVLLAGRKYNCRHSGNYQQYQCLLSGCYCTDEQGKRVGNPVPVSAVNSLTCP